MEKEMLRVHTNELDMKKEKGYGYHEAIYT
jgi:hypothetical protein